MKAVGHYSLEDWNGHLSWEQAECLKTNKIKRNMLRSSMARKSMARQESNRESRFLIAAMLHLWLSSNRMFKLIVVMILLTSDIPVASDHAAHDCLFSHPYFFRFSNARVSQYFQSSLLSLANSIELSLYLLLYFHLTA